MRKRVEGEEEEEEKEDQSRTNIASNVAIAVNGLRVGFVGFQSLSGILH